MMQRYIKIFGALSFTLLMAATMLDNSQLIEKLKNDKSLQQKIKLQYGEQKNSDPITSNKPKENNLSMQKINRDHNNSLVPNDTNETNLTVKRKYTEENYYKNFTPFFYEDQIALVEQIEKNQVLNSENKLERYGKKFFISSVTTNIAGAPNDYPITIGDTFKISVYGMDGFENEFEVNKEGRIIISNVGAISVRGLNYADAKKIIKSKLNATYPNSEVIITIGNMSPFSVNVVGEVNQPGMHTLNALSRVKDALMASKGINDYGSMRNILIKRGGKIVATFDLYALLKQGNDNGDITLRAGDVIYVPQAKTLVKLNGNVKIPAIYELTSKETLEDLLLISGGINSDATQNVSIERSANGQKELLNAKLNEKFILKDQDTIIVGKIANVLNQEVKLFGNVYRKEAIGIGKNESIGTLFTKLFNQYGIDKIVMPNTDMNYFLIKRINKKTLQEEILSGNLNYALNGDKVSDIVLQSNDAIYLFNRSMIEDIKFITITGQVLRSGKFKYFNGMNLSDALKAAGIQKQSDLKKIKITSIQENNSIKIRYENSANASNFALSPYDDINVTDFSDSIDQSTVRIDGAVLRGGRFPFGEGMSINDLVNLSGGLKQNALKESYELVRYEINGSKRIYYTQILNLEKSLKEKMALQPFDEIMIRSISNWDTNKTITLKGEVKFPGIYTIMPGEKLASVIKRAGGFSEQAFIEGSIFTRVDIKKLQEEALERQLNELESIALYLSTQATGAGENANDKIQILKVIDTIRAKAKETPMIGRLSLNLTKNIDLLEASASNLILKGGDTLVVPSLEDSIAIMGEVMSPTAVIYESGKDVFGYIEKAGGLKYSADTEGIFIIKANGEAKRVQKHFLFGLHSSEIHKGDTIVVPLKINAFSGMQFAKDITSIIYQIAVSAAALKTLGTL